MTKPGRSPEETLLTEAFAASRRDTYEPDAPAEPSRIWWRARADELVEEEIRRRKRTTAPFTFVQRLATVVFFLLGETGAVLFLSLSLPAWEKSLAASGVSPLALTVLILAAFPTASLLYRFQRVIRGSSQ
jgi:hypothetical protein